MKSHKTNAFQLAVAGGVLVLVLICATFAWFAVSNTAVVRQFLANVAVPEIQSQLNQIEYSPTGGADAADWAVYNGDPLDIEPGQTLHFRVKFTATETQAVSMKLINIADYHREPVTYDETQTGEESSTVEATTLADTETAALLAGILQYSIGADSTDFSSLTLDSTNRAASLGTYKVSDMPYSTGQYICYYNIKMPGGLENVDYSDYMNLKLSFDMDLAFQQILES